VYCIGYRILFFGGIINNRTAVSCFSCAVLATRGGKEVWKGTGKELWRSSWSYAERDVLFIKKIVINDLSFRVLSKDRVFVNKFIVM
jgi:hypothetical protein